MTCAHSFKKPIEVLAGDSDKDMADVELALRRTRCPVPSGLKGGDADKYVEDKLVELSPYAVADLEYSLMYGTVAQREKARDRILDATGHGAKAAESSFKSSIIILNPSGLQEALPWAKRIEEAKPVEALPVEVSKPE